MVICLSLRGGSAFWGPGGCLTNVGGGGDWGRQQWLPSDNNWCSFWIFKKLIVLSFHVKMFYWDFIAWLFVEKFLWINDFVAILIYCSTAASG